jgi:hypothetical protein
MVITIENITRYCHIIIEQGFMLRGVKINHYIHGSTFKNANFYPLFTKAHPGLGGPGIF